MSDPAVQSEVTLLSQIGAAAYTRPQVFTWLNARIVNPSITNGNSVESAIGYVLYGFLCCAMGQYELGRAFGELGLKLNARQGVRPLEGPANHLYGVFVDHWFRPLALAKERVARARDLAMEHGIADTAAYATWNLPWFSLVAEEPLGAAIDSSRVEMDFGRAVLRHRDAQDMIAWTLRQLLELAGRRDELLAMDRSGNSEAEILSRTAHFVGLIVANRVQRLRTLCLLGDWGAALGEVAAIQPMVMAAAGSVWVAEFTFYAALAALVLSPEEPASAEAAAKAAEPAIQQLTQWTSFCAANREWQLRLLEAELARVRGATELAAGLYDRAVEAAQRDGRMAGEMLSCERASLFWSARERARLARSYLSDAHWAAVRWVAQEKVRRYELLQSGLRRGHGDATLRTTTTDSTSSLDLTSVLKATRAISTEIVLDGLLRTLMRTVVENAGAQRGVLALRRGAELRVEARLDDPSAEPGVLLDQPLEESGVHPAVLRFVERSRRRVVLADARASEQFPASSWPGGEPPLSLLCLPVVHQNKLVGVLYLEHRVATGVFSDDRCALLDVMAAQAAISLENAQLYREQERLNVSLSRFVPSEFLRLLGKDSILTVGLGDAVERDLCVLFSDIRDFTGLSSPLTPPEVFRFLNGYLERVAPVIRDCGGFIDKYIGDAVMALFPEDGALPIRAAVGMQRQVQAYNQVLAAAGGPAMRIGVGIHRGRTVLGTIGEARRMDGTVISDAVNTASRLEALTKSLGVGLLVSGDVWDAVVDKSVFDVRFLGASTLRGRSQATQLWEVFDGDAEDSRAKKRQTRTEFEAAVRCWEHGDLELALPMFRSVLNQNPDDGPARYWLEVAQGRKSALKSA
jgi:class 3 adenylate cyclase